MDPGAEQLRAMMERSQREGGPAEGLQFSDAERQRFTAAFEDREFRKMFAQYLEELQDPSARAENEAYIAQLEGEQKVPPGKQLVRPSPAFCVKSFKTGAMGSRDKLFINIVQSEKVRPPRSEAANDGTHWSVPYSLGPPRMERDKKGSNATAFDCCFHPEAVRIAERQPRFRELLVSTAAEGVEQSFKREGSEQRVDRAALRVIKGLNYVRGEVPTMLVDVSASVEAWEGGARETAGLGLSGGSNGQTTLRRGFLLRQPKDSASNTAESLPVAEPAGVREGPQVPRYTIVERGRSGLGDFEAVGGSPPPISCRPAELVCRIELPLVFGAAGGGRVADICLDVGPRSLTLRFLHLYLLSVPLPYEVEDALGTVSQPASYLNSLPLIP